MDNSSFFPFFLPIFGISLAFDNSSPFLFFLYRGLPVPYSVSHEFFLEIINAKFYK